jgi:Pectate lyase superfamily protein
MKQWGLLILTVALAACTTTPTPATDAEIAELDVQSVRPAGPTKLTASCGPNGAVMLSWRDNSRMERGYRVEHLVNSVWATELDHLPTDTTSATVTTLLAGEMHDLRVLALGKVGHAPSRPSRQVQVSCSVAPAAARFNIEYPAGTPGVYNVRNYGAKGDGVTDDTAAILATFEAIDKTPFSRPNADNSVVYLPDGKYLVSDTINFRQYRVMQGQSEDRTIIQLRDNAPGYEAGAARRAVIRTLYSNNESFANYIRNLSVDTGRGNPGATGILYNTHNTGMLERVTVRSPEGGATGVDLSETEFGPGMLKDVTIEGFDYGVRTPAQPSHATLANITLLNQKVLGIENRLPMTIHGLTSVNSVQAVANLGDFAQLALLDAKLTGGSPEAVAIQNTGSLYLSGIQTIGYRAALENQGSVVPGSSIGEFVDGEQPSLAPGLPGHLNIPRATPPETPLPPVSGWAIPVDGPGDDTAAVQQAIDSGAEVVFLPYNSDYRLSDTVIVRGNVRTVLGMLRGGFSGSISDFASRPMLRVEGNGRTPITFEWTGTSTYPEANHLSLEMASNEDVYLKGHAASLYGLVTNSPEARGRLFADEYTASLRLSGGLLAQVRQLNTENNPFDPANPRPIPTYVQNDGARLSIMGWKTEAPALHALTTGGGQTSVLGGFFRDFYSETVYPPFTALPYFQTTDASLSATYFSYANTCGNTRQLHAVATQGVVRQEIRLDDCSHAVSLYSTRP